MYPDQWDFLRAVGARATCRAAMCSHFLSHPSQLQVLKSLSFVLGDLTMHSWHGIHPGWAGDWPADAPPKPPRCIRGVTFSLHLSLTVAFDDIVAHSLRKRSLHPHSRARMPRPGLIIEIMAFAALIIASGTTAAQSSPTCVTGENGHASCPRCTLAQCCTGRLPHSVQA